VAVADIRYWDATETFLFDFGGGVEFIVTPNLSMYFDVRGQVIGEPDSAVSPSSDANSSLTIPVTVGISFSW